MKAVPNVVLNGANTIAMLRGMKGGRTDLALSGINEAEMKFNLTHNEKRINNGTIVLREDGTWHMVIDLPLHEG